MGTVCPTSVYQGSSGTHQLDIVDGLLSELLDRPLGLGLQGEGEALQGLPLAFHADLCLHLGAQGGEGGPRYRNRVRPPPQEAEVSGVHPPH